MTDPNPPFTIKQWAEDDRPREKLLLKGRSSLSDAELIAILIATGTKEDSAVDLAKKILALTHNNLTDLGRVSINDLKRVKGIGEAKAISIVAALELGRRRAQEEPLRKQQISSSSDCFQFFEPLMADLAHEEFWILLLNRANHIIAHKKVSSGGVSGTYVDSKMIFKYAIENLASGIVLCHNHPSGSTNPSDADKQLTKNIKQGAAVFQIALVDHIIVGQGKYFSFSDSGNL